ncbi:MAG: SdpI family protein, partial [Abitibacteriaceae bacterium]|nr:SdpI family protein [Abditibacteriaceae bacterium]
LYGLALAPHLPDRIPTHWDAYGQVNGWGSKQTGLFLMPGMMLLLLLLLFALPWLSPRNFSTADFHGTFNYVMVITIALMGYMHIIMLQAALHPDANMNRGLWGGLFLFFALTGNVLGKVRRNFWIGIRTPWTLASDEVWIATHRLAARLMVAGGLIGACAAWLGAPFVFCFILLMLTVLIPVPYSLLMYKKMEPKS